MKHKEIKTLNTIKFEKGNTLVVAHRGLSGIEPENTNAAFIAAGNRSYYGIETDIYKTADGNFVVNHDGNLKRIGGENILVEEVTLSTLESIRLFDKDGKKDRADIRPCSLNNYIKLCKKYEKHCVLELKSAFTDEETQRFIDIIKEYDYLENVTFISFKYDNLVKVRSIVPDQSVQFLFSEVTDEIIEKVIADKFDVDVRHTALTKENVEAMHNAGIKINCWTVDNKDDAERLSSWGVDYITSNILE
ncbi:MAG: hypothetical protein E7665_02035 [Ruminococcaceae bacterium]|nr:hypothetical protein [Oscillospiraceae bacterium]